MRNQLPQNSSSTAEAAAQPQLSRRDFLQRSAAAMTGGALLSGLPVARFAHAEGAEGELKLALVGCGGRGSGAANQALRADPRVKLVAMAELYPERIASSLQNLETQHPGRIDVPPERQFVGFEAYKDAIAAADVVILATSTAFRPMQFEEAVRQGRHVFMEKPLAVDAPGVRQILAAAAEAKRRNLKVGVGLQRRHHPGYLETVQRLRDGAIGEFVYARCYWNSPGMRAGKLRQPGETEMQYQQRNWMYFSWLSGDFVVDQGIHNIDVVNWVKGEHPVRAHGMGGNEVRKGKEFGNLFDHFAVEFEYADGARLFAQCRHTPGAWTSVSEHVHGSIGSVDFLNDRKVFTIQGKNPWRFKPQDAQDPYQLEHDALFRAIRSGTAYNEAESGAESTMTAILGRMAVYSGQVIDWADAVKSSLDLMPKPLNWDAPTPVAMNASGLYDLPVPGQTKVL